MLPIVAYGYWRHQGLSLSIGTLFVAACFAAAFGFVEAAVVIYVRAAIGLLPGFRGTLGNVLELSTELGPSTDLLVGIPPSLLAVEVIREAATMVTLISVALLITRPRRDQCAMFLWTFAIWDISYYVGLWATIGWLSSLLTHDVLFLIPVPWFSQVWLPLLVSLLTPNGGFRWAKTNAARKGSALNELRCALEPQCQQLGTNKSDVQSKRVG